MEKEIYKVSVIVPIYNVEKFISRCATSLLEQTLSDVEYIFVDDATPDNSINILQKTIENYPDKKRNCRIVRHDINKGLPAARNTGMSLASGKYIFHCDSDDYVDSRMLESMFEKADESNCDIVWSDWYLSYETKERYMVQPNYIMAEDALKGILSGVMKYNVWNKLIKRSLYIENNIVFPAGHGMAEDMTIIRLFACAKSVAYVPEAFYHYVKINSGAMTTSWSDKHLSDLSYNVSQTIEYIRMKFGKSLDNYIEYFKLNVKLPFLITDEIYMYKLWKSWYNESNPFILNNKAVSFRIRVLQWMAWKGQFWFVLMYYKIVQQFVYTFLFRYR